MMKPKAKLKRGDADKDVSSAAANVEAKDGEWGNTGQQMLPASQKMWWYTSEIRSMMHGFGDGPKPSVESAKLVEKVVHQQMTSLLLQAAELAESRGSKFIGLEEFLFLLRRDKVKLARLIRYLSLKDLKANAMKDVNPESDTDSSLTPGIGESKENVKCKRRRLCQDFLTSIDQTGEFVSLFDEELFDDVRYERNKRAELCTRFMDEEQYFKFAEARQMSFARSNRDNQKLRDWLLQGDHEAGSMLKPDSYAMEVLAYLAFETVAQIVDLALLVNHDAQRSSLDPIRKLIRPNSLNADFPCVRAPLPQPPATETATTPLSPVAKPRSKKFKKLMETCNYSGGEAAHTIQPSDIREAIRRFSHPLGSMTPFK